MAQLAIKGHLTRGKEVIQLLEMLGGNEILSGGKKEPLKGNDPEKIYFIDGDRDIIGAIQKHIADSEFKVFALEEFEKLYPYKVGDKVSIDKNCKDRIPFKTQGVPYIIQKIFWDGSEVKYAIEPFIL